MPVQDRDITALLRTEGDVRRWQAESENASARLEISRMHRNIAYLISQHEPVNSLGVDREKLRALLGFVRHGDLKRLEREATNHALG